jgi:site-specific DNA-methyltransferase (adenine-specific)
MASAIENAGFEIRDSIHWLYGSGFPKSHDVSKAIDKAAGAVREVVGKSTRHGGGTMTGSSFQVSSAVPDITAPATDAAKQWAGWGTALKPAHEPIVVARKPLIGTVAANVQQHGTGALNIDGARVGDGGHLSWSAPRNMGYHGGSGTDGAIATEATAGRWPANVITDGSIDAEWVRYFYCPKASKGERNAGLDALPATFAPTMNNGIGGREHDPETATLKHNTHPTVKPLALMRYLVRLVTPPGGTVLEPFAGSGTTLAAAILEGFDAIGCELTAEYLPIIEGRVAWAQQEHAKANDSLFGDAA